MKEVIEMSPQFSDAGSNWPSEYFLQHRKDIDGALSQADTFTSNLTQSGLQIREVTSHIWLVNLGHT